MTLLLPRASVVLIALDPTEGHEQRGTRPCVVVSASEISSHQRFPMICVVPLTGRAGEGLLYPRLEPGSSGLQKTSWALVDQLRSVDKRRIVRRYGLINPRDMTHIDEALLMYLGLS